MAETLYITFIDVFFSALGYTYIYISLIKTRRRVKYLRIWTYEYEIYPKKNEVDLKTNKQKTIITFTN